MSRALPFFESHKTVQAGKIKDIQVLPIPEGGRRESEINAPKYQITFVVEDLAPVVVDSEYMMKHKPKPGGYYVLYKGYESWSPAEAFEAGSRYLGEAPPITITQRQLEQAIIHLGMDASLSVPDDELAKALIEVMREKNAEG